MLYPQVHRHRGPSRAQLKYVPVSEERHSGAHSTFPEPPVQASETFPPPAPGEDSPPPGGLKLHRLHAPQQTSQILL